MALPPVFVRFLGNRALWEGRYVDPWSITHFISGALVAYVFLFFGLDFWSGFGINFFIAVLWEFFEKYTRISATEYASNNVTDVLFSALGFVAAYWVVHLPLKLSTRDTIFAILALVFVAVVIIGWISYTYYRGAGNA